MSLYDVLGVGRSADQATLRQAYLALARRHHPDRDGGDAARMQSINHAWAVLSDPGRRAHYDLSLADPPAGATATAPTRSGPRPGYEPDPRYPAEDLAPEGWDDVDWDDLDWRGLDPDDRPVRVTVALPRWLRLLPMATLGAAVLAGFVGTVVASEPLLALGFMLLVLAFLLFLSAPFAALLAAQRGSRHDA